MGDRPGGGRKEIFRQDRLGQSGSRRLCHRPLRSRPLAGGRAPHGEEARELRGRLRRCRQPRGGPTAARGRRSCRRGALPLAPASVVPGESHRVRRSPPADEPVAASEKLGGPSWASKRPFAYGRGRGAADVRRHDLRIPTMVGWRPRTTRDLERRRRPRRIRRRSPAPSSARATACWRSTMTLRVPPSRALTRP